MKLLKNEYVSTFDDPKGRDTVWMGWGMNYSLGQALARVKAIAPLEEQYVYIGRAMYVKIPIPFTPQVIKIGSIGKIKKYPLYKDDKDE